MIETYAVRAAAVVMMVAVAAAGPVPAPTAADITTTKTFASTHPRLEVGGRAETALALGMTINDGTSSRYPSYTGFTGLAGTVTDVDVRIEGFSHERPRDVDILLVAPNGQSVVLMSDVGGTTPVTGIDLTFDDEAMSGLDPAGVPQSASWRPSNEDSDDVFPSPAPTTAPAADLSALDGQRPDGAWGVYVVDDSFDYFGSIEEIWIDVKTTGPAPYPAEITVSGLPTEVTDVDMSLSRLRHIWAPDVDLLLVGPQGQQATILSDPGVFEINVNDVDLTLDDDVADPLPDRLVSGTFQPQNRFGPDDFPAPAPLATGESSLSVFDGTDPNGTWRLYVVDDREHDAGTLDGWSLRISAQGEPGPTAPTPTPRGDTTHPRVESRWPRATATRVGRIADVIAVFDEPLRPRTVRKATAYVVRRGSTRHIPALVTWDPALVRIVIDPERRLAPRTTYRVVITTAVTDRAGNRLDQDRRKPGLQRASWRFTTR